MRLELADPELGMSASCTIFDDLRPASPDLLPGARNAVGTCLAIQPGERVALIADEASRAVAASLEQALTSTGARPTRSSSSRSRRGRCGRAPARVLDALEQADAGILCVQPQEGELAARMAIVALVERRRIRYAHMVGVTPRIMREGMRADYRLVDRLSQQLCERMRTAASLDGQDRRRHRLHARRSIRSLAWVKTSGLINPRYWSNLPAGEVFTTPALGGRHVRLRRDRRRLLQRASTAASSATPLVARDPRRPPGRRPLRARRSASRTSGTTATPTRTATASASSRSAPTSACAR